MVYLYRPIVPRRRPARRTDMRASRRKWLAGLVSLAAAVTFAASLKNALDAINAQWQKETGRKAAISYAASSALAKQIEQAAPAQMFISADLDWMDYLAQKNLIKPETRSNLLGNRIVLIAHKD